MVVDRIGGGLIVLPPSDYSCSLQVFHYAWLKQEDYGNADESSQN